MTQLGIGVMLGMLTSNKESVDAFSQSIGKTISDLEVTEIDRNNYEADNYLLFTFDDGIKLKLFDNGQSCCESRWMHTDDNLTDFIGSKLLDAEVREGPEVDTGNMTETESQFLIITTSLGQFTVVNYNEHNGYYGGFLIVAELVAPGVSN